MEEICEISDSSSSDQTIVVENNEIDDILTKYQTDLSIPPAKKPFLDNYNSDVDVQSITDKNCLPSTSRDRSKEVIKNIYSLDEFSDDEYKYEPLEVRLQGKHTVTTNNQNQKNYQSLNSNQSWQDKFSVEDFCEDSNDIDSVLNQISQLDNSPTKGLSKEIDSLIHGDIIEAPRAKNQYSTDNKNSFQWSGSSEDENLNNLQFDKPKNDFRFDAKSTEVENAKYVDSSADSNSEDVLDLPKSKRRKKLADKEAQKLEKELAKAVQAKEREKKKQEKENQKQLKSALRVVENCAKPDQCIQYVTVNIDESISDKHYGKVIKASLSNGGYNFKISKQLVPNLISWTRKVPTLENMFLQNVFQQEKYYLLIMDTTEFLEQIFQDTLIGHIQSILSMPEIQHLSIAILGLQRYYKFLKEQKNKEFQAAVTDSKTNTKTAYNEFKNLPNISKANVETKLVQLQFFCKNIYVRPVEKYEDLAVFVGECTKSVAQIPYKTSKEQPLLNENEFFTVDNRDCVRVDKDGNGLGRLWNQFLKMFPLASLETAEAVSSNYPTMHSLMEAYKSCKSAEDAEKLLQDIPVRRAAGPLSGQRKIGPEFSKKAYRFFCSEENVFL